jgi:hypothetical protein
MAISDVGRFACASAGSPPSDDEQEMTLDELAVAPESARESLRWQLGQLTIGMNERMRYEAMLFAQLVRLTDMLEPYRLLPDEDRGLPPSSNPGDAG